MTAPSASSDPSPRRAVPNTAADPAISSESTRGALTTLPGPALIVRRTMPGSREIPRRHLVGGNDAEPAGLVVLDGLQDLLARVHHERAVGGDRWPHRPAR